MASRQPPRYNLVSRQRSLVRGIVEPDDPLLWHKLPMEIYERQVISKLPFPSLVKFRAVSKRWRSDIIPFAARHAQTVSRTVFLYFSGFSPGYLLGAGDAWWSNAETWKVPRNYILPALSLLKNHKECELLASEDGLLFFRVGAMEVVTDIIASNPLTGQSRALGLPGRLLAFGQRTVNHDKIIIFGAVVDGGTGKYELVIAGVDPEGKNQIYCYNSSLLEWKDGPSLFPVRVPSETGETVELQRGLMEFQSQRCTCCNGNLYWNFGEADNNGFGFVFKFEMQNKRWSTIRVDVDVAHCENRTSDFRIAACKNQVLTWHEHEHPLDINHVEFRGQADGNDPENCKAAPSRFFADSALQAMPKDMIDGMEGYVTKCLELGTGYDDTRRCPFKFFVSFGRRDFFYHVMSFYSIRQGFDSFMRIVAHDTKENVYTELPIVKEPMILSDPDISLENVWDFSASLISEP